MEVESSPTRSAWHLRLDENRRWLRRWFVEQGVEDPEALLWPVLDVEAESAIARVIARRPLAAAEVASVQRWFVEARTQILKVLAMRRIPDYEHDDIAQEALTRALESLGRFRPDGDDVGDALRRWILGIARHVVREHQRRGSAREIPTASMAEGPSLDLSPDTLAELQRRAPALLDRLEALPAARRAAWLAIDLEEAKPKVFAVATKTPYETVYTNLKLARARLVEPPPTPSGRSP